MIADATARECEAARGAARDWIASIDHPLTSDVLVRLDRFESVVGAAVADCPLVLPTDAAQLNRWAPKSWGLASHGWCRQFLRRLDTVPAALKNDIQAALLRAWQPFWGLITYPLPALFSPDEIAMLNAARGGSGVEPTEVEIAAGARCV